MAGRQHYQRDLGITPGRSAVAEMVSFDALIDDVAEYDGDEVLHGDGLDDPRRLETRRISADLGGFGFSVTRRP